MSSHKQQITSLSNGIQGILEENSSSSFWRTSLKNSFEEKGSSKTCPDQLVKSKENF